MKVGMLFACVTLAFCVGCKDEPTAPGTTSGNVMTAIVDGLAVAPTSVTAVRASGRIFIVGTGAFRTLTLNVAVPAGVGDVFLFPNDLVNTALIAEGAPPNNPVWSTANAPAVVGSEVYSIVTFTSISTTGATGSFSLRGGPATPLAIGVRYGNGTFNVKF